MRKIKKILYIAVGIILVLSVTHVSAFMDPYGMDGYVRFQNETGCVGANVTFTNQRTGEAIYFTTVTNGAYSQNALNFPSEYQNGDEIEYYTVYDSYTNTTSIIIDTSGPGTTTMIYLEEGAGPGNASLTVTDGSISFGNLQLTEVANTEGVDVQTVNTTGAGGAQLIEIKLNSSTVVGDTNGTSLTFVSGSPGTNQLRCQFKGGDVSSYTALTTSYQTYDNSMAANTTSALNIQLTMPSSVSSASYYDDYQFEVIVRATLL